MLPFNKKGDVHSSVIVLVCHSVCVGGGEVELQSVSVYTSKRMTLGVFLFSDESHKKNTISTASGNSSCIALLFLLIILHSVL